MKTFLIIEGERSIRQALRLYLQKKGHNVYYTETFNEGLCLFKAIEPDIIIVEDELLKENKLSEIPLKNKPILVLSEFSDGHFKNVVSDQVQTILKPFSLKLFSSTIETTLDR